MTEQKQAVSVAQLIAAAGEARQEAHKLAVRIDRIDDEIEAERERITRRRIEAAKAGQSVGAAADRTALHELYAEKDTLPERHFAARLEAASAHIAVEHARIREVEKRIPAAEEQHERLAEKAAQAQAKAEEAWQRMNQLWGQVAQAKARSKEQQLLLERIEAEGPAKVLE